MSPQERAASEERRLLRGLVLLGAVALVLCVVSRAPTLLSEYSLQGLKLAINVGYVVVFGIPLLVVACYGILLMTSHAASARASSPPEVAVGAGAPAPHVHWPVLFFLPAVAATFLWVQLVFEFAERGPDADPLAHCNTFRHLRMLYDPALFGADFVYCFRGLGEQQARLPDLHPPLQPWLYLLACGLGFWMCHRAHRVWRGGAQEAPSPEGEPAQRDQ